jgi:protease IV
MKQFFGAFFGSVVGIIVAVLLVFLLAVMMVKGAVGSLRDKEDGAIVKANTILRLKLDGELVDREKENPFKELGNVPPFIVRESQGLNTLLRKIAHAGEDANVKGIYLSCKNINTGFASLKELRDALLSFRSKGKFIYSYGDDYSQKEYYLASVADKVFVNPGGFIEWKGLHMNMVFLKGMLEKLDLEVQIFRHGKFKSAIEPFIADKMSPANRYQSEIFLNSIWKTMLTDIAASRKMDDATLARMADGLEIRFPEDAVGNLVDIAGYEDELVAELKARIGMKPDEKLKFVEMGKYREKPLTDVKLNNTKIAVIYAGGSINAGEGGDDEIGSDRLARTIREARLDDKVKAIVLRVNSPGGSAIASEVIWREMELAGKAKPTVVSMGDLAASGGYYISCGAHRIFAQPNTITGSIGVFGLIPNAQKMFANKLGVTFDTVNTNRHSDVGTGLRKLSDDESAYIQGLVEKIYTTFTQRVSNGRKIPVAEVDSIGQGRVWSGADALKINLVDELGGLQDALAFAAKKAGLKTYKLVELPKQKSPFDGLLGNKEEDAARAFAKATLGEHYGFLEQVQSIVKMKGVQARLPFVIAIE